ncbi:MAG: LysR family transcriptional regulator [Flavobacteriales bacterium]|nr:LysR family transcriptional regulator [Flavobacteriales bacterium]
MTLQQLQYVVALDDHRHFVRAAAACFVTQPTLTMQVRKLEEELRVSLFDRRVQPVRPTAIGAHHRAIPRRIAGSRPAERADRGTPQRASASTCRRYSDTCAFTSYRCSSGSPRRTPM